MEGVLVLFCTNGHLMPRHGLYMISLLISGDVAVYAHHMGCSPWPFGNVSSLHSWVVAVSSVCICSVAQSSRDP